MKITIYELLGMIKDGKAPKKIKYQDEEYILNKICLEDNKTHIDYYLKGREILLFEDIINIVINFNDEVEILEEEKKIPEKVDFNISNFSYKEYELNIMRNNVIANTKAINQVIDYLKSKGDE